MPVLAPTIADQLRRILGGNVLVCIPTSHGEVTLTAREDGLVAIGSLTEGRYYHYKGDRCVECGDMATSEKLSSTAAHLLPEITANPVRHSRREW